MRAKVSKGNGDFGAANGEWRFWCRLCAKEDTQHNISVFFKEEKQADCKLANASGSGGISSDLSVVAAIEKYFSVNIARNEELPEMLCTECFSRVTSVVNFSKRVSKVQQMFCALQKSNTKLDLHLLRLKYGLLDEEREQSLMKHQTPEVHYFEAKPKLCELEENILDAETSVENPLEPTRIKFEKEIVLSDRREDAKDSDKDDGKDHDTFNEKIFEYESEIESDAKSSSSALDDEDFVLPKKSVKSDNKNEKTLKFVRNTIKKKKINEASVVQQEPKDTMTSHKRQCRSKRKQKRNSHDNDTDSSECGSTQNKSILACAECPQRFKHSKHFRNHMERKHSQTIHIPLPEFRCDDCSRVFSKKYMLMKHAKAHLPMEVKRIVPCSYCNKKFTSNYTMQTHIRYVHNHERPYICDECGEGLCTKVALKEHMALHTDNPLFVCEVCKRVFKNNTGLKKHREIHDPNKHVCAECGLQLNSRATLKEHMVVHSDEMKYKCDYCGRAFKRAKTLKNHLILHTGLRPYSCEFCGRTFPTGPNCRSHKKKAHPEELAALEASGGVKAYTRNIPNLETLKAVCKKP